MFRVIFTYDEPSHKWVPTVEGAESGLEARQVFSAVVLTCQQLQAELLTRVKTEKNGDIFTIIPAV